MKITGRIGRCATKGCKHTTRVAADVHRAGRCPEHGFYALDPIWGALVESVKCGARCRNAVGPSCDCSCGGENHGIGHSH